MDNLLYTTRRRVLKLFPLATAVASIPAAAAAMPEPETPSVDAFLAKALPSERVRYHSNALLNAMAEMHPYAQGWRVETCHEQGVEFVLVVPALVKGEA